MIRGIRFKICYNNISIHIRMSPFVIKNAVMQNGYGQVIIVHTFRLYKGTENRKKNTF